MSRLVLFLFVLSVATPAWASRALRVTLAECPQWSESEVERLAKLELSTVGGGESDAGGAAVRVTCDAGGATLEASDAQSRRSLSRRIRLAALAEDSERTLAISAAQLVRALDWAREPPPPPSPPERVAPRPASRPRQLELHLGTRVRARDTRAPFVAYGATLGTALRLGPRGALGGAFHYERGDVRRALGTVQSDLLGASLQASLEPWRGVRWSSLWRLELAVDRVVLRGQDPSASARTGQVSGMGAEAQLAVGPVYRAGGMGVALLGQVGAAYFGGRGLVTDDVAVNLNGAWAGLELALLWAP